MLIYGLSRLFLLISRFRDVAASFDQCSSWTKGLVSLCFMAMVCYSDGLRKQQSGMDMAVRLLFNVLALVLFLWEAEGERPRGPAVAEAARESGLGAQAAAGVGPEAGREQLPAEEVGAVEEREETAEEPSPAAQPSPAAEPSPAAAESIPPQPPTEPCEPEPQEDAGDQAAFPSKAEEEELDSEEEKLMVREPASTAATAAPVTSTAASFESSEGFEWPLCALGTCLLIVMGITMLAHTETVFYPQPFCLISKVKQSQVWVLSGVRQQYRETKSFSPRLDSHEWQGVWDSMGQYLVHWAPPVLWKRRRWKAAVWSPQLQVAETAEGKGESSQFAEVKAIQLALDIAEREKWPVLYLYTDSWMVANALWGWLQQWKQSNWQRRGKPIWAAALWQDIAARVQNLVVKVRHVDAHVPKSRATEEHQNNQQVDKAAKIEVAQMDLDWKHNGELLLARWAHDTSGHQGKDAT